jgi:hypothetical protein
LGIEPHFNLWRHFFSVDLQTKRGHGRAEVTMSMGCMSIHLRNNWSKDYVAIRLSTSNKGWHLQWFYLKNGVVPNLLEHALPEFTRHVIEVVLESWAKWGVPKKDVKKITHHLAAIKILKENGVKGSDVIEAYHARRVVPLIAHALLLYRMMPDVPLEGTVLAEGPLTNFKITQRIKEAIEPARESSGAILDFMYLVSRHPPMRPDTGFVEFVSFPLSLAPFP